MNKLIVLAIVCSSFSLVAQAQQYDVKFIASKEDSLKNLATQIQTGRNLKDRFKADSLFRKTLIRALKSPHSFYYPFDSVQAVSILYSPDSVFKIFTWQFYIRDDLYMQKGAIQMRTYDGSLKLFGLIDRSSEINNVLDTVADNNGWVGALYYKIVLKKYFNNSYYTLLGYDANGISSDKKIMEVLTFNNDKPVFGGRYFSFEKDKEFKQGNNRYIIEYKKDGGARMNYDAELDMVVVEHLVPENNEPKKKWTYVGDGDYEGFKWENGKWVHIEKIFDYVTPEGKPPVPSPLNNNGGVDEDKFDSKIPEPQKEQIKPVKKAVKKGKG